MAQSSALRDQPSMDDILASIRKIIDAGENKEPVREAAADAGNSSVPPPAANDPGRVPVELPASGIQQMPLTPRLGDAFANRPADPTPGDIGGHGVRASNERAVIADEPIADRDETLFGNPDGTDASGYPEPDISEIEAVLQAEFAGIDRDILAERQAKYDARFTEADDGAFKEVASLLRGDMDGPATKDRPADSFRSPALTSNTVANSVTQSFSQLSERLAEPRVDLDAVAEEMLRPMLQEWLDNNLPSLVERLVRAEIERIARGDPSLA